MQVQVVFQIPATAISQILPSAQGQSLRGAEVPTHLAYVEWFSPIPVMVDESIREEDGSDDEEKDEDKEDKICQLLDQRTASQRRDKSCAPSH